MDDYRAFLESKIKLAPETGFAVDPADVHPWLRPHARDIVVWACRGGRRAVFAAFGLHKTSIQLEYGRQVRRFTQGPFLTVLPLGVRQEFGRDAEQMGIRLKFIRSEAEIEDSDVHHITNYETVRDGKLDPRVFAGVTLDEADVLRSYGSKTYQEFLPLFAGVPFKMPATATPDPNRIKELIHYAGFLEVMDTGQALTRFFQRNSEKANELTLYPHKEEEFWTWVASWAVMIQRPSDLGHSDKGYVMPPLKITWHEVPSDHGKSEPERDGQGVMFRNVAAGLVEASREKRDSLHARIGKMLEIIKADPKPSRILWHHLEAERHAVQDALPKSLAVYGTQDLDERERRVIDFANGKFRHISTKPEICGAGPNWQRHCHKMIFVGIDYKFRDFIQAIHRTLRFGQDNVCEVDIIYSEAERDVRRVLETKWATYEKQCATMSDIIKRYGLSKIDLSASLKRTIGIERVEVRGERFCVANNDAVDEAKRMAEGSTDLIITSIPFSNHYEYTDKYEDFGHTDNNAHFWAQMDFLSPELLRILKPGRLACIHVKDRILFGSVTGAGAPTVSPFHAEAIFHYRRHGFDFMGMITVVTDVVRENNQTYRLGYTEMCKDGTKMGVGSPEYVLLMRKPQTDRTRGFGDYPVVKDKASYSLSRWQLDAHAFWRSSGDRLLAPKEFANLLRHNNMSDIVSTFAQFSNVETYDHEYLVAVGNELGDRLPRKFMALAPVSHYPSVWTDVNRMRTLNGEQARRRVEQHICPLQFDIVDRLIDRYSMPEDMVYDPFGGLMTVPYRAILKSRRGCASELNADSFRDGVHYLRAAEDKTSIPSLFDLAAAESVVVETNQQAAE